MNLKLLFLLIFFSTLSYAQVPISSYFASHNTIYNILTSEIPLEQTNAGANVVWNFDSLAIIGESGDTFSTPSAENLINYPKTTTKLIIESNPNGTSNSSEIYSSNVANSVSITALKTTDLELNYKTNNAIIGTFPMNFRYSNNDTTAGTYIYGMYLGTFTGTIVTTFDAYGTLKLNNNIGKGTFYDNVSRLKTVQTISLNYGALTNVGTVRQTTYNYYLTKDGSTNSLIFRNNATNVSVPLLGINQTVTQIERFSAILLETEEPEWLSNQIQIIPNPVGEVLNFTANLKINSLSLSDINGRVILENDLINNSLNVAHLQKGIYFAHFKTDKGLFVRKIIKK